MSTVYVRVVLAVDEAELGELTSQLDTFVEETSDATLGAYVSTPYETREAALAGPWRSPVAPWRITTPEERQLIRGACPATGRSASVCLDQSHATCHPDATDATTLRTLAGEHNLGLRALYAALELTYAHHDPDEPLRPRVEALYRLVLNPEGN